MGRKSQETEAPRQLEPQAILPRPLIDQVEEKAAEQLEALYARISSEEALRAEEEQRSRLHPLEIAVLNVQFVLQEVSPIVIEPLRRRKKTEVVLSKGRLMLPEVDGVDYDITSYPNYDSPKRGCVSLAGNILGSSIASMEKKNCLR